MAGYDYDPKEHRLIRHTWQSVSECIDYVRAHSDPRASSHTGSAGFCDTDSFDQACDLALNGWDGARERVTEILSDIRTEVADKYVTDYTPSWDVTGSVVDVEAYLLGEPECMVDFMPEPRVQDTPVVKVLVNTCYSGGFSTEQILQRGTAICGLVDILMALGFAVEVWAECSDGPCGRGTRQWFWSGLVLLKSVNDYVDVDSFAFALAHPSWLRRIMFGAMEGEKEEVRRRFGFGQPYGSGYGKVGKLTAIDDVGATVVVEGALLGVDGRRIYNATDWIRDTLEALGIHAQSDK